MGGEGHELTACQEHKSLLEYSGTFFPRSLETLQSGRASKFPFCQQLFSISFFLFFFFFFLISQITFVFPQSKALTHILAGPPDTLFCPRRVNNPFPIPLLQLGVWVTLENLEGKEKKKGAGRRGREFSKNQLRTYVTEFMQPAPGHTFEAASERGAEGSAGNRRTRRESDALAGISDSSTGVIRGMWMRLGGQAHI